ncbi:MAG: hypothetical protein O7J95_03395, partial [Planctomycetota bacterium]|nr:hypothetical protein [Planctomycetota bacterium]
SGDTSSRAAATEGLDRILMNNTQEVEGFVTSVCNDPGVTVTDVVLGADAAEADFTASEIDPATGAAFGVVIDLFDPMQFPPNIPQGRGHHVASYIYACDVVPAAGQPEIVVNLEFCDGRIGDPLKENLIVSGGRSKTAVDGLVLENGTFTCRQVGPPPREDCTNGIDDDGDGLVDGDDPDCQAFDFEVVDPVTLEPTILQVIAGTTTRGLLALNAPTAESLGVNGSSLGGDLGPEVHVTVQGFSLGFEFDCDEIQVVESFDVSGTVLESLNAEFLQVQADNTTDDGDGCSFILAVLIDAAPPFDGAALPALPGTQPLGLLAFDVREGLACNDELLIVPRDGVTARGNVPVRNVISVDGQAFRTSARPIGIRIVERGRFFRGDCNFSFRQGGLEPINIADAAAVLSFLFQLSSLKFDPPCLDACDANDDGRLDLADAAAVLRFLFTPGAPFPPSPGPGFDRDLVPSDPGPDLSPDLLDCKAGEVCQTP